MSLQRHMQNSHSKPISTIPDPSCELQLGDAIAHCSSEIDGENHYSYFKCMKCDADSESEFISPKRLIGHIRVSGDGEVSCDKKHPDGRRLSLRNVGAIVEEVFGIPAKSYCRKCNLYLSGTSLISRHYSQLHTRRFFCDICGVSIATSKGLKHHFVTKHQKEPRERSWVCDQCGKAFYCKNTLAHHKISHSVVRKFACQYCPKLFKLRSSLKFHLRTHSDLRPFSCNVCGQTFKRTDNLTAHMRIHTGEKPYKCSLCEAAFAQLNSLNVHMKKHQKAKSYC